MCCLLYVSQADQIEYVSGKLYHVSSLNRKELFFLVSFVVFFLSPSLSSPTSSLSVFLPNTLLPFSSLTSLILLYLSSYKSNKDGIYEANILSSFSLTVHTPSPHSSVSSPVLSTATLSEGISENDMLPSPPGPQTSPLLSRFTTTDNPIPSPRCPNLSHSLRYNLDPDAAPSPPCSQHIRM